MTHPNKSWLLTPLMSVLLLAPGSAAAAPAPLTISYSEKTADFLPLWIASDAGYFKKEGLDATVRYLPAQEGIPALISGQAQVLGIGGSDAVSAEAQGTKLKLVATLTPTYVFQFWARPHYTNAAALKGQPVGITSTTGSLFAGTVLALKQLGLTTSDVAIIPLGSVTNVNASLLAGSVVAAASHPPATYKFENAGLVDLVDLAKRNIPSVSAGIWLDQSFLDAHRDTAQKVVNAIVDAVQREKSDPTFAQDEMRRHLGVADKAELGFTYDFYAKEVISRGLMPQAAQIESNIKALSASNPKVAGIDAAAMLDQSLVRSAESRQGAENGAIIGANAASH